MEMKFCFNIRAVNPVSSHLYCSVTVIFIILYIMLLYSYQLCLLYQIALENRLKIPVRWLPGIVTDLKKRLKT